MGPLHTRALLEELNGINHNNAKKKVPFSTMLARAALLLVPVAAAALVMSTLAAAGEFRHGRADVGHAKAHMMQPGAAPFEMFGNG